MSLVEIHFQYSISKVVVCHMKNGVTIWAGVPWQDGESEKIIRVEM